MPKRRPATIAPSGPCDPVRPLRASAQGGAPTLGVAQALERSASLTSLLRHLQQARALFETIAPLLPAGLGHDVRPGPLDGGVWTLLAAHNPTAAKLRQLLPLLLQRLQETGWEGSAIKVRVQPRAAPTSPPQPGRRMP